MLAFGAIKQMRQQQIRQSLAAIHPQYDTLAKYGSDALDTIISILRDPRDRLGSRAIELASRIGGERSTPIMKSAARHENPAVRAALTYVLPRMRLREVDNILRRLLDDRDPRVVYLAIKAAMRMPSRRITKLMISRLAREHPSQFVRDAAAHTVGLR